MRIQPSRLRLSALLLTAAVLGGCATMGPSGVRPGGLSLAEISAMLDAKRPQAEIASEIKQRGLAAQASADDITMLEKRGAQSDVVDALLIASWNDESSNNVAYGYGGPYPGPYIGGDPFYSPWPWGVGVGAGIGYGWGGGYYRGGPAYYGHGYRPGGGFHSPGGFSNPGFRARGGSNFGRGGGGRGRR